MTEETTIHLTTEELGLLASGQVLTFTLDEEVHYVRADDLDCTTRQLAEGQAAKAGVLTLRYD